jgi:hypothetical protein
MKTAWIVAGILWAGSLLTGCGTSVHRIPTDETWDLSGQGNDTDAQAVSQEMIGDLLKRPWLQEHSMRTGERPAVIVGEIRNLSHEHINTHTFVRDIEREFVNSGQVVFVASGTEREAIRDERADQAAHASEGSRKHSGRELGADYMLTGTINTIVDVEGRVQTTYYQVDLALVGLTDNTRVWLGQKKIKKLITRGLFRS